MAGYRQSSFDPGAGANYGPPLRPYNWVQWTGVGFMAVGFGIMLAYFAGRFGWIPQLFDSPTPGSAFLLFSIPLVNSRRQEITREQAARQRHRALIVAAIGLAACAIGFAVAFYVKGVIH